MIPISRFSDVLSFAKPGNQFFISLEGTVFSQKSCMLKQVQDMNRILKIALETLHIPLHPSLLNLNALRNQFQLLDSTAYTLNGGKQTLDIIKTVASKNFMFALADYCLSDQLIKKVNVFFVKAPYIVDNQNIGFHEQGFKYLRGVFKYDMNNHSKILTKILKSLYFTPNHLPEKITSLIYVARGEEKTKKSVDLCQKVLPDVEVIGVYFPEDKQSVDEKIAIEQAKHYLQTGKLLIDEEIQKYNPL